MQSVHPTPWGGSSAVSHFRAALWICTPTQPLTLQGRRSYRHKRDLRLMQRRHTCQESPSVNFPWQSKEMLSRARWQEMLALSDTGEQPLESPLDMRIVLIRRQLRKSRYKKISLSLTSISLKEGHKITQTSLFSFLLGSIEINRWRQCSTMSTQRRFSPEKPTKHYLLMSHYLPPANPSFASLNLLQRVCSCVRFAVLQVLNVLQSPHVKGLVSECQLCWEMSLKWDLAGENQVTGDHSLEEDIAVSILHPLSLFPGHYEVAIFPLPRVFFVQ